MVRNRISSAPDYHFAARPDHGVIPSCGRHVVGGDRRPTIVSRIVSAPSVQNAVTTTSVPTPDDHFAASPDCGVPHAPERRIHEVCSSPAIVDTIGGNNFWYLVSGVRWMIRLPARKSFRSCAGNDSRSRRRRIWGRFPINLII